VLRAEDEMPAKVGQKWGTPPFAVLVETWQRLECSQPPGQQRAVCGSHIPKSVLAFTTAGAFVCLDFPDGINHTNRAPQDSFREPCSAQPPPAEHMPHSAGQAGPSHATPV
jgi:hypothetical protein